VRRGLSIHAGVESAGHANITGTVYLVQLVGRGMRARGQGRILLTGSIAGFMPGHVLSRVQRDESIR